LFNKKNCIHAWWESTKWISWKEFAQTGPEKVCDISWKEFAQTGPEKVCDKVIIMGYH
jgi:hypothetical protein